MRTVRDVMRGDVDVLRTTETVADAACFLASHAQDSVPVCLGDGSLAGSVSARAIVTQVVAKGLDPRGVTLAELAELGDDSAQSEVMALDIDVTVEEAAAVMSRQHRTRLPVLEGRRVVGSVLQRDVARSASWHPPWESD